MCPEQIDFRLKLRIDLSRANAAGESLKTTFTSIPDQNQSKHSAHLDESLEVGGRDEQVWQDGQLAVPLPVLQVQADTLLGRVQRVEALLVEQVAGQAGQTVSRPAARADRPAQGKCYNTPPWRG